MTGRTQRGSERIQSGAPDRLLIYLLWGWGKDCILWGRQNVICLRLPPLKEGHVTVYTTTVCTSSFMICSGVAREFPSIGPPPSIMAETVIVFYFILKETISNTGQWPTVLNTKSVFFFLASRQLLKCIKLGRDHFHVIGRPLLLYISMVYQLHGSDRGLV